MDVTMKDAEASHALTPPASDNSQHNEGSTKNHLSDDAASMSSLSDIEMDDELAGIGEGLGFPSEPSTSKGKMQTPETESDMDDIYANVKPDRVEGGVPVFCPTVEQFKDFEKYMNAVNPYGMKSGIALVDPPEEWKRDTKDLSEKVKMIKVKNPISQAFNGMGGFWTQENMEKLRTYNLPQWKALCEQSEHQPPAQRGTARAGTRARPGAGNSRSKGDDSTPNRGRRAARPRVDEIKEDESVNQEESAETSPVIPPLTPTSPSQRKEEDEEAEGQDEEAVEDPSPTKAKARAGRKSRPRAKAKPGRKPGQKYSGGGGAGSSKKTSVASRRIHNQRDLEDDIDEEDFKDFDYHLADTDEFDDERCAQLEQQYWKGLTFAPPMYGADMPGSLFDDDTKVWNVAKLPNILDLLDKAVPGVNTAYLYLGMWKATFAWHLEDVDLYSINYIHFGAPKQWYSISQADAPKFEKAMKSLWPNDSKYCSQFLRHKTYLVSPNKLLNDYGIKVNKIVHREGQFMITFPYGYHSGFNYGYNCAESVNFALEEWLKYAQTSQKCNCAEDSVFIDVHDILRKLHPENYVDEEIEVTDDEDDGPLPTPPPSVKGKGGRKRAPPKPVKKVKKIKINRGYQPCVLCPHNYDFDDLILTSNGKLAHRKCSIYTTETYIVQENGRDVVYGIENIDKGKWALRCNYCRQSMGVCFQCHTPKCTRAYHATCAVMAGVQVDEADTPRFYEGVEYKDPIIDLRCKTHRTVKLPRTNTDSAWQLQLARTFSQSYLDYAESLKVNDVIQYQPSPSDPITAAVVLQPHNGTGDILVRNITDGRVDPIERSFCVDVAWLLFVDASNSTIPRCSANAKEMPKWLADKLVSDPDKVESKERLPAVGDAFVEGTEPEAGKNFFLKWDGFQNHTGLENLDQKKVDIFKENSLWYFLPDLSTHSRDKYCSDPANPVYNAKCEFMYTVQPPKPPMLAPPPRSSVQNKGLVGSPLHHNKARTKAPVQSPAQVFNFTPATYAHQGQLQRPVPGIKGSPNNANFPNYPQARFQGPLNVQNGFMRTPSGLSNGQTPPEPGPPAHGQGQTRYQFTEAWKPNGQNNKALTPSPVHNNQTFQGQSSGHYRPQHTEAWQDKFRGSLNTSGNQTMPGTHPAPTGVFPNNAGNPPAPINLSTNAANASARPLGLAPYQFNGRVSVENLDLNGTELSTISPEEKKAVMDLLSGPNVATTFFSTYNKPYILSLTNTAPKHLENPTTI
ncbi:putative jumonji family transcription [Phaeomoniella chlamydospora]|uniref:[histone H3]-trimethyl-L-lysine(9) demethylase n=1 Tax=Phaeomoniella chlamydospora TaxID=158046 RepID=A0A0G2E625_PHACM|nr:putative jumonji family transcription [Phaeomoniella chlamydospora]